MKKIVYLAKMRYSLELNENLIPLYLVESGSLKVTMNSTKAQQFDESWNVPPHEDFTLMAVATDVEI